MFAEILAAHDFVLAEAAVIENLKRDGEIDLHPQLVNALLLYDERGRAAIAALINQFIAVAQAAGVPIMVTTPTWRANRERLQGAGESRPVNADAVLFLRELQAGWGSWGLRNLLVGGLMSCKNDCYRPREGLSAGAAARFHDWQAQALSRAGVDFLIAQTLPALPEAIGLARALAASGRPYIISFVINRQGRLLDGSGLDQAIARLDAAVSPAPLGYMVNCVYPSFLAAVPVSGNWQERLLGIQANASALDHDELEKASSLQAEPLADWGRLMLTLKEELGLKILGGCCGTSAAHLEFLCRYTN